MRYREMDGRSASTVVIKQENIPGHPLPNAFENLLHDLPKHNGQIIQTWDVVTPNYHRRRRKGELITNPYRNLRFSRFDSTNGAASRANTPTWPHPPDYFLKQEVIGPHLHGMMVLHGLELKPMDIITREEYGRLVSLAATRAWSGVGHGDTELLVLFAELKKTFLTLLRPLNNLNRLFSSFDRSRSISGSTLSLVDYMAREWLKIRYGILPIMYDIEGILKALSRDKERGQHASRGRENAQKDYTAPSNFWDHGSFRTTYQDTFTDELIVKCGLMYNAKLETTDYLGVNLRSIPSAAWELIPWSFVVDWFVNVQTYIKSLTAFGNVPKGGAYTVITRVQTASRAILSSDIIIDPTGSTKLRGMSGTETIIKREKLREPMVAAPSLTHKIDLSLFNWKDKRVLDALALAFGQFGRR